MENVLEVSKYWNELITSQLHDYDDFIYSILREYKNRNYGNKHELISALETIQSDFLEKLNVEKLIPNSFSSPELLYEHFEKGKRFLEKKAHLFILNNDDYIYTQSNNFRNSIISGIDHTMKSIWIIDENRMLYDQLKAYIKDGMIKEFFEGIKGILSTISYLALKSPSEAHFQGLLHCIFKLIGLNSMMELSTNNGRLDLALRFQEKVYIIECKCSINKDLSESAYNQIIEKNYAGFFKNEPVRIFGIGVSFDLETRNLNNFMCKEISKN